MTATDLIRLATELAECGGVHRLTSLITAAVHVHLEHEHARIERLESCLRAILAADERGQGLPYAEAMDEAAILVGWHRNPCVRTVEAWEDGPEVGVGMSDKAASGAWSPSPHWSQRGAPSRAPERDGECGGPGGPGTDRGALAGSGAPPVAVSPNWGFAIVNNNVLRSNPAPVMPERGERKPLPQSDCQGEYPSGGIIHDPGSPLLALAQDDFGRRKVPKFDGKRTNPEDLGDGA